MKKILVISILIILGTSCEKVLDKNPLDQLSDTDIWNNSTMVQLFLNNLYNAFEVDPESFWETLSDNAESANTGFTHNIQQTNFDKSYDAGWSYSDIRKANLVIANVSTSTTISEEDKDNLIGQAKFFRGYAYFNMILKFGGVVLVNEPLSPDSELKLARSNLADSWTFVINDFKDAALRLKNNVSEKARLTKGAALLMEARAELFAGKFEEAKMTSES